MVRARLLRLLADVAERLVKLIDRMHEDPELRLSYVGEIAIIAADIRESVFVMGEALREAQRGEVQP